MINLLSDTVTKPTKAMKAFMLNAELGDDVFREDPTVNALEEKAASLFGKEAALFCPSGTMCNQIAINIHTRPLDEVWCDEKYHIYQYETAGYSFISGVGLRMTNCPQGIFGVEDLKKLEHPNADWVAKPTMIVLENTCNKGGGACFELNQMQEISSYSISKNMKLHLDGARVFNAIVEKGYSSLEVGACFDSISICLSKGLGAPVGSLLIGNNEDITRARRVRKVLGGGMRQAGIIAAAGIFALDHNVERLREDHDKANELENGLNDCSYVTEIQPVETNILAFKIDQKFMSDIDFVSSLRSKGIVASSFGPQTVRMVTHMDVSWADIIEVKKVLAGY